jgi:hypothetical protein
MSVDLKPEVIRALDREQRVCVTAIAHLQEKIRPLEEQYGWSTDAFLRKFDAGEIGDAHPFFLWHALAEALADWQKTRDSLAELLADAELTGA